MLNFAGILQKDGYIASLFELSSLLEARWQSKNAAVAVPVAWALFLKLLLLLNWWSLKRMADVSGFPLFFHCVTELQIFYTVWYPIL